jgi:hypothetical protein
VFGINIRDVTLRIQRGHRQDRVIGCVNAGRRTEAPLLQLPLDLQGQVNPKCGGFVFERRQGAVALHHINSAITIRTCEQGLTIRG